MGTWIEDSTEEFGKSVAASKLETKVRSDYEITGFMRDWILIVRPFQKILGEHADAMVAAGVMTREEANAWLNMHWEFVGAKAARVAGGAAIVCYGRERQTRAVIHIKTEALVGYERIRLKAETFISARSGAGEDERDLDNLSIAGISERRAEAAKNQGEAPPGPEDPTEDTGAMPDDDDFPFGHFEADEVSSGSDTRGYDVGELWVRVDFDDEFYESVIEAWGMKKEELEEQRLQMAEDASEIAKKKAQTQADDEDEEEEESEGEEEPAAVEDPAAKHRARQRAKVEAGMRLTIGERKAAATNFDPEKAAEWANTKAEHGSKGRCAKYTREALEAGGIKLSRPTSGLAKDYGGSLEKAGFQTVPPMKYVPKKGDVIIFQPPDKAHKAGHMQMYNGKKWVSDFEQQDPLWPSSSNKSTWKVNKPKYEIYRFPTKPSAKP